MEREQAVEPTGLRCRSWTLALTATVAYLLGVGFFTPHVAIWNGLQVPPAQYPPEVNRAVDALAQLRHPWGPIANPNNIVLRWRLLFPIVGRLLHLSDRAYLAIPWMGCWWSLYYTSYVVACYVDDRRLVLIVTLAGATASWFIVSTGWLSYEDSWYVLGLLIVSFTRSRSLLAAACLLSPFVDERFVLAAPLALATRYVAQSCGQRANLRCFDPWRRDAVLAAGLLAPYVLLRVGLLSHDVGSTHFLSSRWSELHKPVGWTQYVLGMWMALRLLWVGVFAVVWQPFRVGRSLAGACVAGILVVTIIVCLAIAADLSRSISTLFPTALLGVCLLYFNYPRMMRWGAAVMVLGNLFLPTYTVVTTFNEPVLSIFGAIRETENPPLIDDARVYVGKARQLLRVRHYATALTVLNWALELDPGYHAAARLQAEARVAISHSTTHPATRLSSPG